MARIEPTPDQLRQAFASARLPGWPAELDAAMADPLLARLVRMHAVRLALGHDDLASHRTVHRPVVAAPEPPHPLLAPPAAPPRRRRPTAPAAHPHTELPLVDRKRAAAGDGD